MTVIIVPIKELKVAKRRQAPLLSSEERSQLARAMLADVTKALNQAHLVERIVAVTRDSWAVQHALHQGWDVILEEALVSESHSVDRASALLREQGASAILRLPADIPLLRAEDVDSLLENEVGCPGALLVPSHDGLGTNALLRSPPDAFPARFGSNSFSLHRKEARRCGVSLEVLENSRIALDLDQPSDLLAFQQWEEETSTGRLIAELNIEERLEREG
ncbi:MAG: 2-phospho-L-lactate guanylyltransferase [Acidobacteriota bacterium]